MNIAKLKAGMMIAVTTQALPGSSDSAPHVSPAPTLVHTGMFKDITDLHTGPYVNIAITGQKAQWKTIGGEKRIVKWTEIKAKTQSIPVRNITQIQEVKVEVA